MKKALIGYSGFVGSNINSQSKFTHFYNSQNIAEIRGEDFDLLVCAGVRAEKWRANQNPEEDFKAIEQLIENLKGIKVKRFVLISTVDVYPNPEGVNENSKIVLEKSAPYGKNRFYFENFVRKSFPKTTIVRLPGLFGKGIKKNLIFDIIHNNQLNLFHPESRFQFYNLDYIWKDISVALKNSLSLVNFSTEPTSVKEIFKVVLDQTFDNKPEKPPVNYDVKTIFEKLYNGKNGYIYQKDQILNELKDFVAEEKK